MIRWLLIALVSTGSAILPARTQDSSCFEMKITPAADAPERLTVTITNIGAPVVNFVRRRPDRDFGIRVKTDARTSAMFLPRRSRYSRR